MASLDPLLSKLAPEEKKIFLALSSPKKIQDFLNTLDMRTDTREPIVRSPVCVLKTGAASCIEGALLAYTLLQAHKKETYLLDLKVGARNTKDVDHVVTLFKENGHWGAISKTNHAVLRYREPVYESVRELAMSYFHEYFTDDGKKNLRSFSEPFDVTREFGSGWITQEDDLYLIACALDDSPHTQILTPAMARTLRLADDIEIAAGKIKDASRAKTSENNSRK